MTIWGKFVLVCVSYSVAQVYLLGEKLAIRGNPLVDPPCVRRPALDIPNQLVMAALREGIPPHRLLWLAWEESTYTEQPTGANLGPLQVNKLAWPQVVRMTTQERIQFGAHLFARWYHRTGSWKDAVRIFRTGH
jgi:hypothetical protein